MLLGRKATTNKKKSFVKRKKFKIKKSTIKTNDIVLHWFVDVFFAGKT